MPSGWPGRPEPSRWRVPGAAISGRGGGKKKEAKSNLYDVVTRVDKACEALIAEAGGVVESLRDNRGVSIAAGNSHMVETMRKFVR